jgi:hypothetical protein
MYYIITASKVTKLNSDEELVEALLDHKHMIPCDLFSPSTRSKTFNSNSFYVIKGEILTPVFTTEVTINVDPT